MPAHTITKDTFTLNLKALEKAASVQFSDITVPLSQIQLPIQVNPPLEPLGFRVGTHVPGMLIAGNIYHWKEQRDFFYVGRESRSIGIVLKGNETYGRIVFDVPKGVEPEKVAQELTEAVLRAVAGTASICDGVPSEVQAAA
ncbi:hypothetical protein HDU67_007023 [Dinochytrium kinnereticum]|nr:hypothetical protein HDU67_007023 [Dinochytrium kinnereticum]